MLVLYPFKNALWALRPCKAFERSISASLPNPQAPFPVVKGCVCLVGSASCRAFGHTRPASVPRLSVGLPPSPRLGLRPKPHFQKLYRFIGNLNAPTLQQSVHFSKLKFWLYNAILQVYASIHKYRCYVKISRKCRPQKIRYVYIACNAIYFTESEYHYPYQNKQKHYIRHSKPQ